MIISGFPGIGKSWLASMSMRIVDLESSSFFVDGKRPEGWLEMYVNVAEHLDSQNKIVFVSSHSAVREEMNKRGLEFLTIYPSIELKNEWLGMLRHRYENTKSEKNLRALEYMEKYYDDAVNDCSLESWVVELNDTPEKYYNECKWNDWKEKLRFID